MDISFLKKSYKNGKESNKIMLISNSVLAVSLSVSLLINVMKDTIVISNVNPTCDVMEISSSKMNIDTHKRLGFFLSNLLGNITPESVDFVSSTVLAYMSPKIYNDTQEKIALQIKSIKEDQVTLAFIGERAVFEDGDNPRIFITGKQTTTGATGIAKTTVKTYEFHFTVSNYTPTVKWMDLYEGNPHDQEWLNKEKRKADKNAK